MCISLSCRAGVFFAWDGSAEERSKRLSAKDAIVTDASESPYELGRQDGCPPRPREMPGVNRPERAVINL